MEIEYDDHTYELAEEITGGQYLELQGVMKKANADIAEESKDVLRRRIEILKQADGEAEKAEAMEKAAGIDMPTPDMDEYGLENLIMRLKSWSREGEITRQSILALPSGAYQALHWKGLNLDGQENAKAQDFLVTLLPDSKQAALALALETSTDSPQDGSEQPDT